MKKLPVFIVLVLSMNVYSQNYWDYNINFDDSNQFFRITIDTILNPNNNWQIGEPQKTIFNNAYSSPNVIITDTINSYLPSDTSIFIITHVSEGGGFTYPHTAILSGYYKSNCDSLNDFGLIEFSPDQGATWIDLINDPTYDEYLEWSTPKPILTGSTLEWTHFWVNLAGLGEVFNIELSDTLYYKFSFVSDSIIEELDGLMFDNLHFEDWYESINDNSYNHFNSKVFPNPAISNLTIEYDNLQKNTFELTIFNIDGQEVLSKQNSSENKFEINLRDYTSGLYFYKLVNIKNNQKSIGKFLINN
jgi:hypothetical protein